MTLANEVFAENQTSYGCLSEVPAVAESRLIDNPSIQFSLCENHSGTIKTHLEVSLKLTSQVVKKEKFLKKAPDQLELKQINFEMIWCYGGDEPLFNYYILAA